MVLSVAHVIPLFLSLSLAHTHTYTHTSDSTVVAFPVKACVVGIMIVMTFLFSSFFFSHRLRRTKSITRFHGDYCRSNRENENSVLNPNCGGILGHKTISIVRFKVIPSFRNCIYIYTRRIILSISFYLSLETKYVNYGIVIQVTQLRI